MTIEAATIVDARRRSRFPPLPIALKVMLACCALWLLRPVAGEAQNTLRWTTNFYSVTGATIGELRQSLGRSRPWKEKSEMDGHTSWKIDCRFHVVSDRTGCRCSSFLTTTTITTTLPRWHAPTNVPAEVREAWVRYITALGEHEAGHARIALAAAAEQHKRVGEIGAQPDCASLRQRIERLAVGIVEDHRRQEVEYDRRTGHGVRDGVSLGGGRQRRE